ncbi:MAG TPA: helix-hairpin-helix domain-containing protein [Pyrinomonadaceae bacterium]|jgi:DNA polymerase (family 10)|nr:helix-hairpin-helix domain-containing protein [Pyrinomonadaceae bacterium]
MTNEEIARRFARLALLMEIRGDDKFRVRSYRNAAETVETWPSPVERIAREEGLKGLQTLPGVGKAISGKIVELLERGTFDAWERLKGETPETVLDLLEVEGVGLKTASALYQQFKVSSLEDLRTFVEGGGLDLLDGVGEKTAERIRASVRRLTA